MPSRAGLSFLRQYLSQPHRIGAVWPSSQSLARALTKPLSTRQQAVNVLELGAGTGAVTRSIVPLLGPADRLDLCEANPELAQHLKRCFLDSGPLQAAHREGRVRLFDQCIQDVQGLLKYDYIISGLPFTAFEIRDVVGILNLIKRQAKTHCIFSYFEYMGIRPVMATLRPGKKGRQFRKLSAYLSREISAHQIGSDPVLRNVPPAHARHLRFGPTPE